MEYLKKFSVFLMTIMIISMVSGAYAANTTPNNDNDDIESNIIYVSTDGNDNWNGLAAVKDLKTGNGPKKTIKAALNELDREGTVKLAPGMYHENNIIINQYVTIEGCGANNTFIDGKRGKVFYVNASSQMESTVIFKDLSVENAQSRFPGSAIYNNGIYDVLIKNCNFHDNKGRSISNGGGITIENCGFDRNQDGAVINYAKMEIRNSVFNNNYADNGGAIYNTDGLSILNCTFAGNDVSANPDSHDDEENFRGGAIYNENGALDVKDSIFISNNADVMGGAIYNIDSLYVENCKFISNRAKHGGAIATLNYDIQRDYLVIDNNQFINNEATIDGGAIYKPTAGTLGYNMFSNNSPDNIKIISEIN